MVPHDMAILTVDDLSLRQQLLKNVFRRSGYSIIREAPDGAVARQVLLGYQPISSSGTPCAPRRGNRRADVSG